MTSPKQIEIMKDFVKGTPNWIKEMQVYRDDCCMICGIEIQGIKDLAEAIEQALKDIEKK